MSSTEIFDPDYEWSEPVMRQRKKERRERRRRYLATAIALLVITICAGGWLYFSNAPDTEGAQPRESYEGYWLEEGYIYGGERVDYSDLPSTLQNDFKFRTLSIGDKKAYVAAADKDSVGKSSKWEPTAEGLRIGNLFEHEDYNAEADGALIKGGAYYVKYPEEGAAPLEKVSLGKISIQMPRDLAFKAKAMDVQGKTSVVHLYSGRDNGPQLIFQAQENDYSGDLAELAELGVGDYSGDLAELGVGDYSNGTFVFCNGANFLIRPEEPQENEARHEVTVEFIFDGMQYKVSFIYSDEDPLDYADYVASFCQMIDTGSNLQASDLPDGAISWSMAWLHLGEQVTAYGPVKEVVNRGEGEHARTYVNIGMKYPNPKGLYVIIWVEDRGNFPESPADMYRDKTIAVTGVPYVHNEEAVYIKVESPAQIQVLE